MTLSETFSLKKWEMLTYIVLILAIIFTPDKGETSSVPTLPSPNIQQVISGKLPKVGEDAYWAINPKNPSQKILLVPSFHFYNLRAVNPRLSDAMRNADILIVEDKTGQQSISWDDATLIQNVGIPMELLTKIGLVREQPFLYKGTAWTRHLKPETKEFLVKNYEPVVHPLLAEFKTTHKDQFPAILDKFPLDNVHPALIMLTLQAADQNKLRNIGMDRQILRFFDLNQKPIFGVETLAEKGQTVTAADLSTIAQIFPDQENIYISIDNLIKSMKSMDQTLPNQSIVKMENSLKQGMLLFNLKIHLEPSDLARNAVWVPRFIEYFNTHKDKSFVVVVGGAHYPGPQGIMKLLADQGFTFRSF